MPYSNFRGKINLIIIIISYLYNEYEWLNSIILKTIKEKILNLDNITNILNKAGKTAKEKIENYKIKSEEKFQNKRNFAHYLIIKSNTGYEKTTFNVLDENENVKYIIKSKSSRCDRKLKLLNSKGKIIGLVKQKGVAKKAPKPYTGIKEEYIIEIHGKKLGNITAYSQEIKTTANLSFNKWKVEGKFFSYQVLNEGMEIAKTKPSIRRLGRILEFSNPDDEVLLLLITIALTAVDTEKKPGLFSSSGE